MEQVDVYTKNGQVWIEQASDPEEPISVVVEPSQVPLLVQWLQEAASQLLQAEEGN